MEEKKTAIALKKHKKSKNKPQRDVFLVSPESTLDRIPKHLLSDTSS